MMADDGLNSGAIKGENPAPTTNSVTRTICARTNTAVPLVNDLASSTVQQIFVRSCLPYTPADSTSPQLGATQPDSYNCEDCGDKFLFASSLKFHVDRYSVKIKFACKDCSRQLVFYNRCNFLAHLRLHNAGLSEEELAMLDITSQPICNDKLPINFNISDYLNQPTSSEPLPLNECETCFECNMKVSTTLKDHYVGDGSPGGVGLSCKKCQLIMPTKCSFTAHARIHLLRAPFICPDCSTKFTTWDLLSDHLKYKCFHNFKVAQYQCDKCPLKFKRVEAFYTHIISNHLKCQMVNCQKCAPFFNLSYDKSKGNDASHLVKCELCYAVISLSYVKQHVKTHAISRSYQQYAYKCSSCDFTCKTLRMFSTHHHNLKYLPVKKNAPSKTVISSSTTSKVNNVFQVRKQSFSNPGNKTCKNTPIVLDIDKMPLTPSPEPLAEEDPLLLDTPMPPSTDVVPPAMKTVPQIELSKFSLIKSRPVKVLNGNNLTKTLPSQSSNMVTILKPINFGNQMLQKRHQCSQCEEFIIFDGKANPVERHFEEKHPGYKVFVAEKNPPKLSMVNGNPVLVVKQNFKVLKKDSVRSPPNNPKLVPIVKQLSLTVAKPANGLVATNSHTSTSIKNINGSSVNLDSPALIQAKQSRSQRIVPQTKHLYSLSKSGKHVIVTTKVSNKDANRRQRSRQSSDDLSVSDRTTTEESSSVLSSPKRKVKRFRKKKMLDPDFVCNDSDSEGGGKILQRATAYSGLKTPPKAEKVKKKQTTADSLEEKETPTRGRKRKIKTNGSVQSKLCVTEALGSGLVISPSKHDSDSSFVCASSKCQFSSKDREEFKDHAITHRVDKNTYQCMECGLCFVVKPTFTKHLFIAHQISDSELYILNNNCCDEGLIQRGIDLTDYQKIRAEDIPTVLLEFQCNICYKPCDDALSLNSHFRTHGMAFLRSQFQKSKS